MPKLNINKFKDITFDDCLNFPVIDRTETYAKELAYLVIERGKENHNFDSLDSDDKCNYYLKQSLIQLVGTRKWSKFLNESDYTENQIMESLYISLKRQYYCLLNEFPN